MAQEFVQNKMIEKRMTSVPQEHTEAKSAANPSGVAFRFPSQIIRQAVLYVTTQHSFESEAKAYFECCFQCTLIGPPRAR